MREIISPDSYLINLSRCAGHALGLSERKKKKRGEVHRQYIQKYDVFSKILFSGDYFNEKKNVIYTDIKCRKI